MSLPEAIADSLRLAADAYTVLRLSTVTSPHAETTVYSLQQHLQQQF